MYIESQLVMITIQPEHHFWLVPPVLNASLLQGPIVPSVQLKKSLTVLQWEIFRIHILMEVRKRTICLVIFYGDILLHRPEK